MENTLNIQLKVDAATGMVSIKEFNGQLNVLSDSSVKTKTHVENLGISFVGLKSMIDMAAQAFGKIEELTADFSDAENASIKLDTALQNASITNPQVGASFRSVAAELEKMVNIDGDAIIGWQALATEMGNSPEMTNKVVQAAIGLNKTFGTDMETAIKASTLGYEGNFLGLQRLIPQIKLAGNEQDQMAAFLKVVNNGWNQATAAAGSLSGQLAQQKIQWGNVKEEIGGFLTTALLPILKSTTELTRLAIANKEAVAAFAIGFGGAKVAMWAFSLGIEGVSLKLKAMVVEMTMATGGLNLLFAAIAGAAAMLVTYKANQDLSAEATAELAAKTEELKLKIQNLSAAEIKALIDKAELEKTARNRTIAYMELKAKELEQLKTIAIRNDADTTKLEQQMSNYYAALESEKKALSLNTEALRLYNEQKNKPAVLNNTQEKPDKEKAEAEKKRFQQGMQWHNNWNKGREEADQTYHENINRLNKIARDKSQKESSDALKAYTQELRAKQKLDHNAAVVKMQLAESAEKIAKSKAETEKQAAESGWNTTMQLGQMMAQKSKEGFAANQALQIANATMSTYAAATKALEAGPILGPIFEAITIASGMANVAMIAAQSYEPVEDFVSIPGRPLLKTRADDVVIGGTNLFGAGTGSGGNSEVVKAIKDQTKVLRHKQLAVSVDPLTGEVINQQNRKGERSIKNRRV